MSNEQSAKGMYKIPSASRSFIRKEILNIYSEYQANLYAECIKCYSDAKCEKPRNQIRALEDIVNELNSGEYVGLYKYGLSKRPLTYDLSDYLAKIIRSGKLTKPMKKDFPTMPALQKDGSRYIYFDSLESRIKICKNAAVIEIDICSNNHNVDCAMESIIGRVVDMIVSLKTHGARSGGGLVIEDEYTTGEYLDYSIGGVGAKAQESCNMANIHSSSMRYELGM